MPGTFPGIHEFELYLYFIGFLHMEKKPYTIVDLARILGVSKSTVSRALRDKHDVNPATREKVLKLAKDLDFESNNFAASLRSNKSNIIGVVIPSFAIPFYSIALGGIQFAASKNGYNVMVCQTDEKYENEISNINFLLKAGVDGILVSLSKNTKSVDHLINIHQKKRPVVLFNRAGNSESVPRVVIDDYTGALNACRHLIKTGSLRIAHISGPKTLPLSENRTRGYTDALSESGLAIDESLIFESDFSIESGKEATRLLLSRHMKPDAIFCICDAVAYGAMAVIKERGLKIPEEIEVIGFTNEPMSSIVFPSLTTVSQPINEIGQTATGLLMEFIKNGKSPYIRQKIVLPTEFVLRESTKKM